MKTTVIPLKIETEAELYHPFDAGKETLSDEVKSYLLARMEEIPVYEQISIEIETNNPIDIEHFRTCYEQYINGEIAKMEKEIRYNNMKKIRFFVIGLIFIVLSVLLATKFNTIIIEILSIVGSFSIWELTNLILIGNRELKWNKLNLKREQHTQITLKKEGEKSNV